MVVVDRKCTGFVCTIDVKKPGLDPQGV